MMDLKVELKKILPEERIKTQLIDRIGYASDAGFYKLIPLAVVQPDCEREIIDLFHFSHLMNIPLVFRTGGTSLSGQSITDGILVDLSRFWNLIKIEEQGESVRVQPGITGAMVNRYLKKYHQKIGPDPSSIGSAMMGGILSNNASGMCCGVKHNSYHTIRYLRFVLTDGRIFSSENSGDYGRFVKECQLLASELVEIRETILSNADLYQKVRKKYETKNTVGYSLNAFIDYEHPLDIFTHLLVGAEGTLAFISEAVLETIADLPCKATALLFFPDIYSACETIPLLIAAGAEMVELMDRASLSAIENMKGMDPFIRTVPASGAALLIEFQELDPVRLDSRIHEFLSQAGRLSLLNSPHFTREAEEREFLWKVRKGLFPSVGAVRAKGTTVILEDVVFPLEVLGNAVLDLQQIFKKYGYLDAIIFGHAKDGNLHFVVTQSFENPADLERYSNFLGEVVQMVVKRYHGSLKAEHGTGRNMAPFVETEWGAEAYQIMQRIKKAADPLNLLNPGVIINEDPGVHLKNIKNLPVVEEEVDKCIECGYCEHKCPSRDLTLTPRRRIVVRRAMTEMKSSGDLSNYKTLLSQYQYSGLDTCAVDGLCASACPVDINTGDLVKRLRFENHTEFENRLGLAIAKHFHLTQWMVRLALKSGLLINQLTGQKSMTRLTRLLRKIVSSFPLWNSQLSNPPVLHILKGNTKSRNNKKVVYFPTCISRVFGTSGATGKNIIETFLSVAGKAGIGVIIPAHIQSICCGQSFSSKGLQSAFRYTANRWMEKIWASSEQGLYPVVSDLSSCTYTLHHIRPVLSDTNRIYFDQLTILDSIDFLHDLVVPVCKTIQKSDRIVLHPVCSLEKMGLEEKFKQVAEFFSHEVVLPVHAGCCGMAGDRGFLFPELTRAATAPEAVEVGAQQYNGYYSSAKTCEMAMGDATGKNYESILFLADACLV